jgi:Asp-tRNA(Asn)/Glu-tRNA(Gln) amidotransferase A subunit family amidase
MELRRHHMPAADAPVATALKRAGAVILGKHSLHEAAMGPSATNPHYGSTHNPHRRDHSAGGSSTGAGAALAAGLCAGALGTDTLGSVRIPAAFSGIAALCPTPGRVSAEGVLPLAWSLDVVGPMARQARSLPLLFAALTATQPAPDLRGATLGVLSPLDEAKARPDVMAVFDAALDQLRAAGFRLIRVTLAGDGLQAAFDAGLLISRAEAFAVHAADFETRPDGFSAPMRANLERAAGLPATDLVRAMRARARIAAMVRRLLAGCAALVMPTTPLPTYRLDGPVPPNQPLFTALANVAGCPAVSVPMGFTPDRLPLGLQFLGAPGSDESLMALAALYEEAACWDMTPPGFD